MIPMDDLTGGASNQQYGLHLDGFGSELVAPRVLLRAVQRAREAGEWRRAHVAATPGAAVRRPAAAGVALPVSHERTLDAARGAALAVLPDVRASPSASRPDGGGNLRSLGSVDR